LFDAAHPRCRSGVPTGDQTDHLKRSSESRVYLVLLSCWRNWNAEEGKLPKRHGLLRDPARDRIGLLSTKR
jgi:hypothetical protein